MDSASKTLTNAITSMETSATEVTNKNMMEKTGSAVKDTSVVENDVTIVSNETALTVKPKTVVKDTGVTEKVKETSGASEGN